MKKIIFIVIAVLVCGCVSQIVSFKDYTNNWLGRPVSEKKKIMARQGSYASRIGWKTIEYQLVNGSAIFVEPDREDCYVHWEVDTKGIIIGFQAVGQGCK